MSDYDAEHDKDETPEQELLEQCLEHYRLVCDTDERQRDREEEALRFLVPQLQWRDEDRAVRQGDGRMIPARPTLSISLLDQPRQLILNQMRQADLGVEIHPISPEANDDTAEAIQGLYRHIERTSRAELVRFWAFDRAVACGRGAYRILTDYDEEGGDPSDQKIVLKRILHQEGVFFDPRAEEPDYSDGEFVFVCTWMSKDDFKRTYPKAALAGELGNNVLAENLSRQQPEWVKAQDVLVAEYWYKEHAEEAFEVQGETRTRDRVTVKCCKVAGGFELLEEPREWITDEIPVIPVVGKEIVPFDDERRYVGLIEPAMDGQRVFNVAVSNAVERASIEPKAPWLGAAEVFEGYEDYYKQANIRNFPFLPYKAVVKDGQLLPPPQRASADMSGESLALQLMQASQGWVQSATAVFDPSLGRLPEKDRSGKAIMALQSQADAGTGHFLANLVDISMTAEARQVLKMLPKVYDRPGRVTRILTGDKRKAKPVMLNRPFIVDERGRPQAYQQPPMPQPPQMGQQMAPQMGQPPMPGMQPPPPPVQQPEVKHYDLAAGTYGVSVSVGKSYQTKLQEGSEKMGEFLAKEPQLFAAMGDIYLQYQDWPGAKEMAKRAEKLKDSQFPFLRDDAENGPGPDQLKGEVQQLKGQMQQQGQALQQAVQVIQSKQAEQQAKIEVAQIQAQAQLEKAKMDNETKLQIAGLDAQIVGVANQIKIVMEHVKQLGAERSSLREQAHAKATAAEGRAHEVAMGAMKHEQALGSAAQGAAHEALAADAGMQDEESMARAQREHEMGMADRTAQHQAAAAERAAMQQKGGEE